MDAVARSAEEIHEAVIRGHAFPDHFLPVDLLLFARNRPHARRFRVGEPVGVERIHLQGRRDLTRDAGRNCLQPHHAVRAHAVDLREHLLRDAVGLEDEPVLQRHIAPRVALQPRRVRRQFDFAAADPEVLRIVGRHRGTLLDKPIPDPIPRKSSVLSVRSVAGRKGDQTGVGRAIAESEIGGVNRIVPSSDHVPREATW